MNTIQPEKLNLWDRIFNRYRTEVVEEGESQWCSRDTWGREMVNSRYVRSYIKYRRIDRLTGSVVEVYKRYLD